MYNSTYDPFLFEVPMYIIIFEMLKSGSIKIERRLVLK